MGCVIEELLMTRKELLRKPIFQACESVQMPEKLTEISLTQDMLVCNDNVQTKNSMTNQPPELVLVENISDVNSGLVS